MDWRARSAGLRIGGHRGASAAAPENTWAAFERAIAEGAEYVETDIRKTSDGELVLLHDETVDRTTDGQGHVAGLTLEDVLDLDAGAWYGDAYRGERIPRFASLLRWVEGHSAIGAALEVKAHDVGAAVARAAWDSPARDRLAIYSFHAAEIAAAKRAAPDLPCVLLLRLTDEPTSVIPWIDECGADGADVPWQWDAVGLIAAMRARGMIVGGGSATGDEAAADLLRLGVDMIDTDGPGQMRRTIDRLRA
jgi:glycerophosphoryl diester phosphodiesterase